MRTCAELSDVRTLVVCGVLAVFLSLLFRLLVWMGVVVVVVVVVVVAAAAVVAAEMVVLVAAMMLT